MSLVRVRGLGDILRENERERERGRERKRGRGERERENRGNERVIESLKEREKEESTSPENRWAMDRFLER